MDGPGIIDDEPKVTTASDIYSFGMVLWELVARQLPYVKAPNPMVAARWIEKGKKEEIPGDCPPMFKKIIESSINFYHKLRNRISDLKLDSRL